MKTNPAASRRVLAICACALLAAASRPAAAETLLSVPVVAYDMTKGGGNSSATTSAPNNYPDPAGQNTFQTTYFDFDPTGPFDLTVQGVNSGGTTLYNTVTFYINPTNMTLSSMDFQLGSGVGAAFVPFSAGPAPFFTPLIPPSAYQFSTVSLTPYDLRFSGGGGIPANGAQPFNYGLALPDLPGTAPTFTLRITPGIAPTPSPSSALVLLCGATPLASILLKRRRK